MFRLPLLAHGKIALPDPLRGVSSYNCFGQWNVSGDVSFPGGIFTARSILWHTSFPSISATNLYLHFYLCFCLCLHVYLTHSLALTVSLLVTYVHTSHVFLSTPLLHSLCSLTIYIWPSTPASSKWQPWTPSLHDHISIKKNLIAQLGNEFSSLDHVTRGCRVIWEVAAHFMLKARQIL